MIAPATRRCSAHAGRARLRDPTAEHDHCDAANAASNPHASLGQSRTGAPRRSRPTQQARRCHRCSPHTPGGGRRHGGTRVRRRHAELDQRHIERRELLQDGKLAKIDYRDVLDPAEHGRERHKNPADDLLTQQPLLLGVHAV
jgi:hypothetical protein